jgi:hypothetical protein
LNTKNFQTKPGLGWNGGLSIRGNFTIIGWYSIQRKQFYRRYKEQLLVNEDVNLKLASAQISLQLSYRLIKHILSIEFGPIVQVGGKFKSEYDKENNIISGTPCLLRIFRIFQNLTSIQPWGNCRGKTFSF